MSIPSTFAAFADFFAGTPAQTFQAQITVEAPDQIAADTIARQLTECLNFLTPDDVEKFHDILTTRPLARAEVLRELRKA